MNFFAFQITNFNKFWLFPLFPLLLPPHKKKFAARKSASFFRFSRIFPKWNLRPCCFLLFLLLFVRSANPAKDSEKGTNKYNTAVLASATRRAPVRSGPLTGNPRRLGEVAQLEVKIPRGSHLGQNSATLSLFHSLENRLGQVLRWRLDKSRFWVKTGFC